MPRTLCVDDNGGIHFYSSDPKRAEILRGIDAIIYCSGYDYHFDFINEDSNLDLKVVPGERRVAPLYKQLWHARHPSIAFIGLPNYVVPFPLFEIQANAVRIATQQHCIIGRNTILPIMSVRLQDAERDAVSGGPNGSGRVQDTHSLGSHQWDYCRDIAKISGLYDSSVENYLAVNKQLHSFSMREKKATIPGGEDTYRLTRFHRDDNHQTRIISSGMPTLPSVT
eukprot:scaffold147757_cov27-Cyclotella_meneghiniana.AAC.1